jgi:hypothetical protein
MEDIGANECCSLFRKMRRKIDNKADWLCGWRSQDWNNQH